MSTHSEEWKRKQSKGVKRAWAEGKYVGKPRPDYSKIAAKNRGRKRSDQEIEQTRQAVKKAWADGKYDSPETRAKLKESLDKGSANNPYANGRSGSFLTAIRALRDMDKLRPKLSISMKKNVKRWRADGTLQKNVDWNRKRLTGGHGQGKNTQGSLLHSNAKIWKIRDSVGRVFEFINCREWVRKNIDLFHDYRPESRMPFPARVAAGLKNISHPKQKNASTHYQGWTIVSVEEKKDLLGRDEAEMVVPVAQLVS